MNIGIFFYITVDFYRLNTILINYKISHRLFFVTEGETNKSKTLPSPLHSRTKGEKLRSSKKDTNEKDYVNQKKND